MSGSPEPPWPTALLSHTGDYHEHDLCPVAGVGKRLEVEDQRTLKQKTGTCTSLTRIPFRNRNMVLLWYGSNQRRNCPRCLRGWGRRSLLHPSRVSRAVMLPLSVWIEAQISERSWSCCHSNFAWASNVRSWSARSMLVRGFC